MRDTPYLKFLAMRSDWILADEDGEFSKKVIFVSHRLCWHSAFKSRLLTGTFPDLIKGPQFHYSTNVQSFAELWCSSETLLEQYSRENSFSLNCVTVGSRWGIRSLTWNEKKNLMLSLRFQSWHKHIKTPSFHSTSTLKHLGQKLTMYLSQLGREEGEQKKIE